MDQEFESEWKQVGSLANGVLRSVMEKRKKQVEMMAAASLARSDVHRVDGQQHAAKVHPAHGEFRSQPDLPLFVAAQFQRGTGKELPLL